MRGFNGGGSHCDAFVAVLTKKCRPVSWSSTARQPSGRLRFKRVSDLDRNRSTGVAAKPSSLVEEDEEEATEAGDEAAAASVEVAEGVASAFNSAPK